MAVLYLLNLEETLARAVLLSHSQTSPTILPLGVQAFTLIINKMRKEITSLLFTVYLVATKPMYLEEVSTLGF